MSPLFRAAGSDFDRLYREHAASVYRYAFAVLGNHPDAEDVTQQTFLNAYRAIARGTRPRKAENWLVTIAHNEVRRHFRDNGKTIEVQLDDRLAGPDHEDPRDPSLADVLRALQKLPPLQRSALVMREFEGRSYAEIADMIGVTQSALEALLFRGRRALAEHLEGALTCAEAEEAVSRRLDGRLPRREGRRLKRHLQECALCVRFVTTQKRQRALLKGLSVMPVPASLFLFRPEPATAAGLGATGVAATAGASAGTGALGLGAGVAAKAAAVAAAAAVAGGVGYGVATSPDSPLPTKQPAGNAAAIAHPQESARRRAIDVQRREQSTASAPVTKGAARRNAKKAKTKVTALKSDRIRAAKPQKSPPGLVKKLAAVPKLRPVKPARQPVRAQPRRVKPAKKPKRVVDKPTPLLRRPERPKPPPRAAKPPPPPEPAAAAVKKPRG